MSSWYRTKPDSNQFPQLQRLARKLDFACIMLRYGTLLQKVNNKGTDRSAPLMFKKLEDRVSRIEVHINFSFPVSPVVQFHY